MHHPYPVITDLHPLHSKNGGAAADGDGKQDAITPLRITQDYVDRLERDCDEYNAVLTKLRSFILPGGTPVAAQLHVARTVPHCGHHNRRLSHHMVLLSVNLRGWRRQACWRRRRAGSTSRL